MRRMLALLLLALAAGPAAAQSAEEVEVVRALMARVLPLSHHKGLEHCGFVGRDPKGRWVTTGPVAGTHDTCTSPWPEDVAVVSSWHTHGDFDASYFGELPSAQDLRSDRALGVSGWVGTPGGRLWYVDSARMVTKQVCGAGCLPVAPGYDEAATGPIAKGYAYEDLLRRMALVEGPGDP